LQYTYLGKTGMKVSRLCLGTGNFGGGNTTEGNWGSVGEKEAHRIMDAALDMGINFFDTANVYGEMGPGGHTGFSEEIIGRWFAQGDRRRDKVILGTKVERTMLTNYWEGPNQPRNLSLYKIRRHFAESLKRLQTDHIELYQMHHIDRHANWEELWEAFEGLVKSGQVDYIGSSNFAAWDIMKANEVAHRRNFIGLVNEQHRYNLLSRYAELEVLPMAADQGIGITLFSPLVRGVLGMDILEPDGHALSAETKNVMEKYRPQLTAFAQLCHDLGEKPAAVSLAWILANPVITAPVIGPATVKDLEEMVRATEITLDEATMNRLDEIFPGHGGDAPEAYAGWAELTAGDPSLMGK